MQRILGGLPLSWKLVLPSLGLIVVLGVAGGFLIVRDLSVRSQAALDVELSRASVDANSALRVRELSLLESANFAANVEGIASAVRSGNATEVARRIQSVLALKTDLELLVATDRDGRALVEFTRAAPEEQPAMADGREWAETPFVRLALDDPQARKFEGLAFVDDRPLLALAAPICSGQEDCSAVGVAVVGFGVDRVVADVLDRLGSEAGLSLFAADGQALASAGSLPPVTLPPGVLDRPARANDRIEGIPVATLYTPFEAGDLRLGTLAVSVASEPTLASVRRTALGLGLILVAAMAGMAGIGVLVSRAILRQVRSLVATNRALGQGDLSARAQVESNDEMGELAFRLNEMAEQLQAMYETLELRVAQRTEEIERLLRERTEFFASVSHELRTPLAVILRHAEMLVDEAYQKNGRWRTEAALAFKDSGGQLAHLIDDILELAEVEATGFDIEMDRVDLASIIRDMRRTVVPLARAADVGAEVRVPKGETHVLADPHRVRQIVLNLVDNAIKYTPPGGSVEVSLDVRSGQAEVSVSDSGIGVPPEAGERLFEPFYRAKGTSPQHGGPSSGLGLAVARRLADAHGGSVTYASRPRGGTTFTFSLPLAGRRPSLNGSRRHGDRLA